MIQYLSDHPTRLTKGYNHESYGQLNLTRRDANRGMNMKAQELDEIKDIELRTKFEPKPRNICSACGKDIGFPRLIAMNNINICFQCLDAAKQLADERRKEISKKEIERIAHVISTDEEGLTDIGMSTTAYMYAERLYKAGYRKVE